MADLNVPGDQPILTTLFKVTQKFPNGSLMCKVFHPQGMTTALGDLLAGVSDGSSKTVEVSSLQLNLMSVNLEAFFKAGGLLFSTNDIK